MDNARRLAVGLVVPAIVAVYLVMFWMNIAGQDLAAVGFPQLLIVLLAILVVVQVTLELKRYVARTASEARLADPESPIDPAAVAPAGDESGTAAGGGFRPMLIVAATLAVYICVMPLIGAYPSTALFAAGLSLALGYRNLAAIAVSVVVCVATVAAFIETFNLPLAGIGR